MKKSNAVVVSQYSSHVRRFFPVTAVILLGIFVSLFGYIWVFPFAIGLAIALVIWILAGKNPDAETRKFFDGLARTFLGSALMLAAFGVIAVFVVAV
jgi:hypothetical protein